MPDHLPMTEDPAHLARNLASPLCNFLQAMIIRLTQLREKAEVLATPGDRELLDRATSFDAGAPPVWQGFILPPDYPKFRIFAVRQGDGSYALTDTEVYLGAGDRWVYRRDTDLQLRFATPGEAIRGFEAYRERAVEKARGEGVPEWADRDQGVADA